MLRVRVFRIVIVRVCADVSPMTVSGKFVAGNVTVGSGNATPMPESAITSGPLTASDVTVTVSLRAPIAVGVKVKSSVHEPAGGSGEAMWQVLTTAPAMVVERQGRLTGYTTDIAFFGHTVGETTDDLKALIGAAEAFGGPGFLAPSRNGEILRWCLARGLRITQSLTLMTTGLYNEPAGAWLPSILY